MKVLPGSTVDHLVTRQDFVLSSVEIACSDDEHDPDELVEKPIDEVDACSNCLDAKDEERIPDELLDDESDEEDELDDGGE